MRSGARGDLRVAYVLKRYPTYSETFIVNEILAHEAAGLRLEIFSLRPPSDTHFQDRLARVRAPVTYVSGGGSRGAEFWKTLESSVVAIPDLWSRLEFAQGEDPNDVYQALWLAREAITRLITHLHAHFASVAASVTRLAALFAAIPYTFTAHAKDIYHDDVRSDALERKLRDAAAVVTVSDYNVQYLRDRYGPIAGAVRRVYNGLDLADFPYRSPGDRPARIVAVGRLVEKKGFADLIAACAELARSGRDFSCVLVGAGALESDLRGRIRAAGLESRVELLGPRPQAEIVRLVQDGAAFAAPCVLSADGDRDGLPTVLLEAMALGTPCVSTDVTGIPEVLRHEDTGLIVPQHDPAALAQALDRLLGDARLRVRLATRARQLVEREFDIHRNSKVVREMFCLPVDRRLALAAEAG